MNLKEMRKLSIEDLDKDIYIQRKNLYEITIKVKTCEEKNTSLISNQKKIIAQLETVKMQISKKNSPIGLKIDVLVGQTMLSID